MQNELRLQKVTTPKLYQNVQLQVLAEFSCAI